MFDYMNTGMIVVMAIITITLFIFIIISDKDSSEINIVIFIVWIGFESYSVFSTNRTANNNIQHFKANKAIQCNSGFHNTYKVSLKNNWKLDGNYFIKDSLMIRAEKCEVK